MLVILIGVTIKTVVVVVLICISLMISDIEHLFMSLLDTCISSLEKYLFKLFGHLALAGELSWLEHCPDIPRLRV